VVVVVELVRNGFLTSALPQARGIQDDLPSITV
jgi:hypothetical protein